MQALFSHRADLVRHCNRLTSIACNRNQDRRAGFRRTRQRDDDYRQFKERIADGLLRLVESRLPGFSSLVAHRELSTPVTNEFFTGHHRGAIYGLTGFAEPFAREANGWASVRTPISGLYLTGVDTIKMAGIVPGMLSGIVTLNALPSGPSFLGVVKEAGRRAKKSRRRDVA